MNALGIIIGDSGSFAACQCDSAHMEILGTIEKLGIRKFIQPEITTKSSEFGNSTDSQKFAVHLKQNACKINGILVVLPNGDPPKNRQFPISHADAKHVFDFWAGTVLFLLGISLIIKSFYFAPRPDAYELIIGVQLVTAGILLVHGKFRWLEEHGYHKRLIDQKT
jgi:hypothetical protein